MSINQLYLINFILDFIAFLRLPIVFNLDTIKLFYDDCPLLVTFENSLDQDQVTVLCVCMCVCVCLSVFLLKKRRNLNNYCPKTVFKKASWPISYTSMHNQCLNIDVQVETCMTVNLLKEIKRSMTVDIISRSISVGQGRCEN